MKSPQENQKWFRLALAFLLVNAYGVWKITHRENAVTVQQASPAKSTPDKNAAVKDPPPLALESAEQVNITAEREVTLRLVFNATPDRNLLPKFLKLSEEDVPELGFELVGHAGSNVVLIKTAEVTHDRFVLALAAGLPAKDGTLGTVSENKRTIAVTSEFQFQRLETESPAFESCELRAVFSSKPDPNGLTSEFAISPSVKFVAEPLDSWRGGGAKLTGDFKPGAVYTVTIRAGLKNEMGTALPKDIVRTVQFPNRPPSLSFASSGRYLSPRGKLLVPVSTMNLRECEISISPVFANNLVQLAHRDAGTLHSYYGELTDQLIGRGATQTNMVAGKVNEETKLRVNLRDLVHGEPHGVYWMEVHADKTSGDKQLVVITDIGIAAHVANGGVLAWVNSLRDAKPVANADVVLYAKNNQEISRGMSDSSGLIFLSCKDDDEPFVVTAKSGDDLSYLDLSRTEVSLGGGLDGANYLNAGDVEASVFTERGVYRPGETAHMQALVRDAKLNAPKPFPALFRVRKPDGRVFKDVPVMLDAYGSAEAAVPMPDYLPTGRYTLELAMPGTFTVLGESVVSLEDFVPPQIRVDLSPSKERGKAGEPVGFSVKSEHLFGRAASGLKVNGFVSFKAVPFAPAQWKGWKFGDDEKPFSTIYRQLGAQMLDENGKAEFAAETSDAWRPPAAMQAVQQATVVESSGRPVTAYGSSFLDVYPFYIGLRAPAEGTLRVGETQRVSVVEVLRDGTAAKDAKPLNVKLAREQWNSVLRRDSNGRYEWKSERNLTVVREDTIAVAQTASSAQAADQRSAPQETQFAFAVDSSGEYVLTFADPASGTSSSIKFHAAAADQEWVEWSREKPDHVELALDREKYRPGDSAKLLIKAPFSGLALLTIESDRVLTQRLVTLQKNTAEIEVPVRADYVPNVYCAITLIRPATAESVWTAHRAAGAIALNVEPPSRRLNVAIDAPATNRPQAQMQAKLTVRDEAGTPAQGDVTVMAVDEAICMLTAFETPDPMKTFLAQRRLGVKEFDLYRELMPVMDDEISGVSHIGGDSGSALRKRLNPIKANRFKPVALWKSNVHLDTNGQADVAFDVPEFSGEMRLMAVAYNASQSGSSEASVKVKRGLVVQPSLPRFLAPGDVCEAAIDIYNESGRDLPIQVRLTCGGPLSAKKAEESFGLKSGGTKTVRMPLKAGAAPGKALCTIEVSGGTETYRETIELAVRPAAGLQVAASFGVLKAGEKKEIAPPAGWVPESIAQEIWVSGQPSLKLGRALDYVMHYPYGCLEQTVSGSFPLLYAADIANRILPQSSAREDVNTYVQAGILRALSMQQGDGSFALWPYERGTHSAASLYAAHFLVEAQKASYAVPPDRLDAALNWLRERLDKAVITEADAENSAWATDMQERAYACHVLALAGKPDHGWNARLREEAPRLSFAARVHTASALLLAGEPRQATELLGQLGMPAERPREIGGMLNSDVRDAALLLSAWLDVDPKNEAVERLAQFLDRKQRDGHWSTTQDDAMALLALGKYAQRVPADKRPFTGLLALPEGMSRAFSNTQDVHWVSSGADGSSARADRRSAPRGAVTVVNDGPGPLYFSSRIEGVPLEAAPEADAGLRVRREFYDMNGTQLDATALTQGDLVVVKLTVDTLNRNLDNIAIEELLPAGWEIENPSLSTSQQLPWIKEKSDWCLHRDIRDDRLILFTGGISGANVFYYAARAVTPGHFIYPPVTAACMYDPEIRSVSGRAQIEVKP